jgi:hypothetical protein
VTDRRTALVAAGYDAMADTWESWSAQITDDARFDWLERSRLLLSAFDLIDDEVLTVSFHWILAQR